MLLFLTITATLYQSIPANGFLNDCPINRDQRIGDTLVTDILETFYKDLVFVQACTERRQMLQYYGLLDEMLPNEPETESEANLLRLFIYLQNSRLSDAFRIAIGDDKLYQDRSSTYYHYLEAETKRLIGDDPGATRAFLLSFSQRQKFKGISINRLERLDGLLVLQKLHWFNMQIDEWYGLDANPNYQLFDMVHFMLKQESAPLKEIELAIANKLGHISSPNANIRSSPHQIAITNPNFIQNSIDRVSVENMLCKFARIFNIIGEISGEDTSTPEYGSVIDQMRRIDPDLAYMLEDQVVNYIETNTKRARKMTRNLWRMLNFSSKVGQRTLLNLFHIELNFLQSEDTCSNMFKLYTIPHAFKLMVSEREEHEGLSLGKLAQLGAKVVLQLLKCFHERVKLAYDLDGSEDEQQLKTKRSELGDSCERIIPFSILLQWNTSYE